VDRVPFLGLTASDRDYLRLARSYRTSYRTNCSVGGHLYGHNTPDIHPPPGHLVRKGSGPGPRPGPAPIGRERAAGARCTSTSAARTRFCAPNALLNRPLRQLTHGRDPRELLSRISWRDCCSSLMVAAWAAGGHALTRTTYTHIHDGSQPPSLASPPVIWF